MKVKATSVHFAIKALECVCTRILLTGYGKPMVDKYSEEISKVRELV